MAALLLWTQVFEHRTIALTHLVHRIMPKLHLVNSTLVNATKCRQIILELICAIARVKAGYDEASRPGFGL
ncbi:MAG: hypothetical protein OEV58_15440 [Gammaproteobacteria bacterium]|nr:hypothetical protein [Gammaproteobacteria bacterium]